jgi:cobalt-zinc-cadmium efflux system protein
MFAREKPMTVPHQTGNKTSHGHHGHDHAGHGHDHHGHSHAPDVNEKNARAVAIAGLLICSFMFAELIGGYLSGSLALMADALHMVTDAASLGLAWWAFQQTKKAPTASLSYGRHRLPVLIAFANAIFLLIVTGWICVEAVGRFITPEKVLAGPMLTIAILGLLVNIAAFFVLRQGGDDSLNIRSAILHVLGDLLGSVAAIAAAIVITFTGWYPIDPILSVFVALLIVRSAVAILRQSGHILLEGTPETIDCREIMDNLMKKIPGLEQVHHVHVWTLAEGRLNATLHARVRSAEDGPSIVAAIREELARNYGIGHATIECEIAGAAFTNAESESNSA